MPETITPRVVAICHAVNRRGVSSSSSASIFEVLRDSQILGSDRLKNAQKCAKTGLDDQLKRLNMICGNAMHAPKIARKTCAETTARHG